MKVIINSKIKLMIGVIGFGLIITLFLTNGCQKEELGKGFDPLKVGVIEAANSNNEDSNTSVENSPTPIPGATVEMIASSYPNDEGIENDSRVVLAENFENKTLNQILSRWTDVKNRNGMSLEKVSGTLGDSSLRMNRIDSSSTIPSGSQTGGYLWMRLDQLNRTNINKTNNELLYLRFYLRLDPDSRATYHHTGGGIGGVANIQNWPVGSAGIRPTGSDRFSTRAEVDGNYRVDFYTYWMGMHKNATVADYYGNSFVWDNTAVFVPGGWTCVEYMLKLNNPVTEFNGEQRIWVNNREVGYFKQNSPQGKWLHETFLTLGSDGYNYNQTNWPYSMDAAPLTYFEGFQWRNINSLNLNYLSIEYYSTKDEANGASYLEGKVWWDNIVLATSRIGCSVSQ